MFRGQQFGAAARRTHASALWGTGTRGDETRGSVLWGKGGRGRRGPGVLTVAICALTASLAATAAPIASAGDGHYKDLADRHKTWVARGLLDAAKRTPSANVRVIIQSDGGVNGASRAFRALKAAGTEKQLDLVGGIAVELPAKLVERLSKVKGLTVTPDDVVQMSASSLPSSDQLWPYESGNSLLWTGDRVLYAGKLPAIAVVDSGVDTTTPELQGRVVASVNLCSLPNNSSGDGRGHGTFVAGIAAGNAPGRAGAAPTAPLVSVDVMDDSGQARTSDVIAGAQWVLANKDKYNIKVANFSLHSLQPSNFLRDPLDLAVEKLWFAGVTVVAAAGNYGTADGPSGVKYAPGNDPFVITVGAADLRGTARASDDTVAPWSAYGYTYDGFFKPELAASGRYMLGPVPAGSTLAGERADKLTGDGRIELSGTSFAAPVVAGTAAQLLARHPSWGPDQVKGALMATARPLVTVSSKAGGLGELNAMRAALVGNAPNPNRALERFLTTSPLDGQVSFDAHAWADAAKKDDGSWADMAWTDMAWTDSNVAAMAWTDMAWTDMAWTDVAQLDMAWTDMAWTDNSREDAAEDDTGAGASVASPAELAATTADPALQLSGPEAALTR
jgi:serine protease AprX